MTSVECLILSSQYPVLCCSPQIQHAKPARIQLAVCDVTGSCHRNTSYKKSKDPPFQDAKVFWGASSGLWTELLQGHKHPHHLQQNFFAASFLWGIKETDNDMTRKNSITECHTENTDIKKYLVVLITSF